jgi:hypothetical protein
MEIEGGCDHVARSEGATSNQCMWNGCGGGGGRKRRRIRETLVSKYIDHFRSICQVYLKGKRISFFCTFCIVACGSRPMHVGHKAIKNVSQILCW